MSLLEGSGGGNGSGESPQRTQSTRLSNVDESPDDDVRIFAQFFPRHSPKVAVHRGFADGQTRHLRQSKTVRTICDHLC